jgi:hypothetical protein
MSAALSGRKPDRNLVCGIHPLPGGALRSNIPRARASGDNTATQTGRTHDCTDKMTARHRQKTPAMQELSKHTFMKDPEWLFRRPTQTDQIGTAVC